MPMNSKLILTATALAVLSIIWAVSTTSILRPPPISGSKNLLHTAETINLTGAVGPESLAFDPSGKGPYTGVADGRILKWQGHQHGWVDFAFTSSQSVRYLGLCDSIICILELFSAVLHLERILEFFSPNTMADISFLRKECIHPFAPHMEHICGRPLGLRFDQKNGDLYVADAYLGLQVVGSTGGLATQIVTEVEGAALRFTNDMDIDEHEDVIYFTDTSTIFQRRQFILAVLSEDKTGRLMKYDKSSKEVTVLLRGLAFANGVALSKYRSFVLVAETTACRIVRFWLRGPNAGKRDIFVELPGFPDNIRRNSKGEFWVALHSKTGLLLKWVISNSWFGKTLLKLPLSFKQLHHFLVGGQAHATAIKLSEEGKVLEALEDIDGKTLRFISEVEEKDGKLWIGSVLMPFIGIYNLN